MSEVFAKMSPDTEPSAWSNEILRMNRLLQQMEGPVLTWEGDVARACLGPGFIADSGG